MATPTTNVPPPVFTPTGLSIPPADAILTGEQADLNSAFGGNLDFVSDSAAPQVQWSASITAIIFNVYSAFLFLVNMFNPAFAFGRYQDALGLIYNLTRDPAEPTVVQATCTGAGVTIPVGALAIALDGTIYEAQAAGSIAIGGGSIVLPFAAITPGPIACPQGALNKIYQAIPGWDSIINLADGVIGQDTESQSAFEQKRQDTLAANANNTLTAVRGAVLKVAGVLDVYTAENDTTGPLTIGGFTLVAKSMYVAVVGGVASDVANAIWSKKPPGCAMNGNTSFSVQDTRPPYVPPYPTTVITWETPASVPFFIQVTLVNGPDVPANALTLIQNAIIGVFAGNGGVRPRIGSTVLASSFYGALMALGSWVRIVSVLMGSPAQPECSFTGAIAGNLLTVSAVASGALAAGQYLADVLGNVLPGTFISISAGGGTGVYTLNQTYANPVSAEAMTSQAPDSPSITVGIAQSPTINANDVALVLV